MLGKLGQASAAKVKFQIVIRSVDKLPKIEGQVKVEWKRTSGHGETKLVNVIGINPLDYGAFWNEKIEFTTKIFKDKQGLAAKNIAFHLKVKKGKGKSSSTFGSVTVNLTNFVKLAPGSQVKNIDIPLNKEKGTVLKLEIISSVVKMKAGKKKLTPNANGDWDEASDSEGSAWEQSMAETSENPSLEESETRKPRSKKQKKPVEEKKKKESSSDEEVGEPIDMSMPEPPSPRSSSKQETSNRNPKNEVPPRKITQPQPHSNHKTSSPKTQPQPLKKNVYRNTYDEPSTESEDEEEDGKGDHGCECTIS